MAQPTHFESLAIPRKGLESGAVTRYRIYEDETKFTVVEAVTALEAFEASGLKNAYKIERERLDANAVVGADAWPKEEKKPAEAAADAPPAEAAPAAEEPKA